MIHHTISSGGGVCLPWNIILFRRAAGYPYLGMAVLLLRDAENITGVAITRKAGAAGTVSPYPSTPHYPSTLIPYSYTIHFSTYPSTLTTLSLTIPSVPLHLGMAPVASRSTLRGTPTTSYLGMAVLLLLDAEHVTSVAIRGLLPRLEQQLLERFRGEPAHELPAGSGVRLRVPGRDHVRGNEDGSVYLGGKTRGPSSRTT